MIDLTAEKPIPLAAAATLIPPARNGKKTHLSTILRWILRGSKAPDGTLVKLEAVRLGGRWLTSREALQRFSAKLTPSTDAEAPAPPRTPAMQSRASSRAAAELERIGV
jgi:Protein of unknown function (DUF1580)